MHASTSQTALTAEVLVTIEHWPGPEALAAHTIAPALTKLLARSAICLPRQADLFACNVALRLFDDGVTLVKLRWQREDHKIPVSTHSRTCNPQWQPA